MESLGYEDSLFSSLLGEGLEKDSLLFDTGVDGTPVDKYAVTAEDLFKDLGPLDDWMTEKVDLGLLGQPDVFTQTVSTLPSELDELLAPKGAMESLEVGPEDLELLQSLAVDPGIPQSSPSPEESFASDFLTLTTPLPVSSMSESGPGSPSILTPPLSVDSMSESGPGSPSTLINPASIDLAASDILTTLVQMQQNKEMADKVTLVTTQTLTPPPTPKSITDVGSVAIPKENKKNETPKRARSKIKTASGSTIVDKKSRKRDQNKMAATRYREKKRAESMIVQSEESQVLQKNKELKEQVESLTREIKYMKDLMVDIFEAKGITTQIS